MHVTVVMFQAYNQTCKETYLDKSPEEIHDDLMDICPTYQTIAILRFTEFEHQPISTLQDFDRPEHRDRIKPAKKL